MRFVNGFSSFLKHNSGLELSSRSLWLSSSTASTLFFVVRARVSGSVRRLLDGVFAFRLARRRLGGLALAIRAASAFVGCERGTEKRRQDQLERIGRANAFFIIQKKSIRDYFYLIKKEDERSARSSKERRRQLVGKLLDVPPVHGHFLPAFSGLTFSAPHLQSGPQVQTLAAAIGVQSGRGELFSAQK